jgi:hypothetical protein
MAAEMRADARTDVQGALPVTTGRQPVQAVVQDTTLSRLELIDGVEIAGQDVFGKVLQRRNVLADIVHDALHGLARGIVCRLPGARSADDQVLEKQPRQHAMGDALAGIAGRDEYAIASGIAADEPAMVDGAHYLARPAVDFLAEQGNELVDPGLDGLEALLAIIGFARLVVFSADDQVVGGSRAGIEPDVVIGVPQCPSRGHRAGCRAGW